MLKRTSKPGALCDITASRGNQQSSTSTKRVIHPSPRAHQTRFDSPADIMAQFARLRSEALWSDTDTTDSDDIEFEEFERSVKAKMAADWDRKPTPEQMNQLYMRRTEEAKMSTRKFMREEPPNVRAF